MKKTNLFLFTLLVFLLPFTLHADLVAEYRFDDCTSWDGTPGEVKDSTGNHHGTKKGNAQLAINGKINYHASFDSDPKNDGSYIKGYIEIANGPNNFNKNITVMAWVKPSSLATWDTVIVKSSHESWQDGWAIYSHNGKIIFMLTSTMNTMYLLLF